MAACNTVVVSKRSRPTTLEIPSLEVPFRPRSLSPIAPSPPSTPPPTPPTPPQTPQIEEECHVTFDRHLVAVSRLRPVKFLRPESLPRATPNVLSPLSEASTPPADLYEAESPDELALVRASFAYGCKLVSRDLASIRVLIPGSGICEFEVLHVLPFDSNRKRMSVIVRHSDTGQKVLYCKGADSSIFENLSELADSRTCPIVRATEERVLAFARSGLRVLLTARRALSDAQFEQWSREHKVAAASVANREKKLSESYAKIETNLQLTGATGVEDRLQDGVPETLSALRCAGVRVWVLTGDKHETAVNVAYACNLFTSEMQILKLQCRSKEATERMLFTYRERLEANLKGEEEEDSQTALVVDGVTLVYILDRRTNLREKFMHVACMARAVLVVRANPLQKALIVRAAKQLMNALTLAVGDGANDVSMIQAADVGVGIFGVEGRQAAMASDFAVSRFRHLAPLMLVHGHWAYHRLANTILYFFYKNACFVFLLLWYQLYCGFSTTVMIDDLFLVSFNLLFTSLPPLAFGIYDQDASRRVLSSQPRLYAYTRLGRVYAPAAFWLNLSDAFYQSIAIFFVAVGTYYGSDADIFEFGTCITHACLITQLLHIAIETKSWTALTVGALLSSYFLFLAFGFVYTTWCTACLSSMPSRAGEFTHALGTSRHWLAILLSTVLALLPRLSVRSLQCTLWPDVVSAAVRRAAAAADLLERRASVTSVDRCAFECVDISRLNGEGDDDEDELEASEAMSSFVTMTTIVSNDADVESSRL